MAYGYVEPSTAPRPNIPGTTRAYDPRYGGIPNVPNLAASASNAIGTNMANLSSLYGLTTGLDTAAGAGVIGALGQEIPGVQGLIGTQVGNIGELQSGQVPADVIAQLQQQAAEIGAGSGMGPMAPSTNAGYLRALGLTSLGMKEKGAQELNALMGSVPRANQFDPSSMLLTPGQEQEWQYLANELAAAPEPRAAREEELRQLRMGGGYGDSGPPGGFSFAPMGPRMPGTDSLGFREPNMGGTSYPNLPILGAINPSSPAAARTALPPGINYGAGGGWSYDPTIGGYVNAMTGQIADTPGGTPWSGFSAGGVNRAAEELPGAYNIQDPMFDYEAMMDEMGYEDYYEP